jgi:hypothetical protein
MRAPSKARNKEAMLDEGLMHVRLRWDLLLMYGASQGWKLTR